MADKILDKANLEYAEILADDMIARFGDKIDPAFVYEIVRKAKEIVDQLDLSLDWIQIITRYICDNIQGWGPRL